MINILWSGKENEVGTIVHSWLPLYVYSFVQVLLLLVLKHLVKVQLPGCCPEQTVWGMNPHCYNVLPHNTQEEGVWPLELFARVSIVYLVYHCMTLSMVYTVCHSYQKGMFITTFNFIFHT